MKITLAKIEAKVAKEVNKAAGRFGESFDEAMFKQTNPRVSAYIEKIQGIEARMKSCLEADDLVGIKQLIEDEEIVDPVGGSRNWTDVRQFNLMFSTEMGGSGSRRSEQGVSQARNSTRNFRELFKCSEIWTHENSFWNSANWKGVQK